MLKQEKSSSYKCIDYISASHSGDSEAAFSCSDRQALCNWGYQAIKACNDISNSTVLAAITYFDRFLSSSAIIVNEIRFDIPRVQLAFVCCLVIALKVNSGFHVESDFVSEAICKNMYEAQELIDMEIEILRVLSFKLSGPTGHDFIDYFLEVTPCLEDYYKWFVSKFSKALVDLAVTKYAMAIHLPSEIALAAICCTLEYAGLTSTNSLSFLQTISGLDMNDAKLRSLFKTMIRLVVHELIPAREAEALMERQSNNDDTDSASSECSPTSVRDV